MAVTNGRVTLLQLSDLHATAGDPLYGTVDAVTRLDLVAEYVARTRVTPEAVLVTGDLVQRGHAAAYPRLAGALARLGAAVGAPVLAVAGNHDDRAAAAQAGIDLAPRVVHVGPVRLVLLDSTTESLGAEQVAWLGARMGDPDAEWGTVVVLHHPPVPSPLPTLRHRHLGDARAFADALASGAVPRIVVAGHFHHPLTGSLRLPTGTSVPVAVGPSLAYQQVMDAGPETVAGSDSAMFQLVQITVDDVGAAPFALRSDPPIFTQPVRRPAETTPTPHPAALQRESA